MARSDRREGGEDGGLPRLPPGRHGLPREFVVANQRDRIAAGMIRVVVAEGYAQTTVSKVVAAAGVSRRTFYNYYPDKAEAFFEVYRQVTDFICESIAAAAEAERGWPGRVRAELATLLETFAVNPDLVGFVLLAPPAAGGEVAAAHRAFLERLLGELTRGRTRRARRPPPAAEYGLIGGLAARIATTAGESGPEDLRELLPEAVELVLTPYLGREAAVRAAS